MNIDKAQYILIVLMILDLGWGLHEVQNEVRNVAFLQTAKSIIKIDELKLT
jgi:hypothetical protein